MAAESNKTPRTYDVTAMRIYDDMTSMESSQSQMRGEIQNCIGETVTFDQRHRGKSGQELFGATKLDCIVFLDIVHAVCRLFDKGETWERLLMIGSELADNPIVTPDMVDDVLRALWEAVDARPAQQSQLEAAQNVSSVVVQNQDMSRTSGGQCSVTAQPPSASPSLVLSPRRKDHDTGFEPYN